MEDFARELAQGSGLYLLYGEEGIGKTRLLQELQRSRLSDTRIHWIDLRAGRDDPTLEQDLGAEFIRIAKTAETGDIVIADHFEGASNKTRHQLFQCWVALEIDKQLSFIVASATHGFNDLRQLSLQYKVRVQSFQQQPYSREEVDAFIGFFLYPDSPLGNLSMPAQVRMQLTNAGGIVGKVVEIANRDGAQIQSTPINEAVTRRQANWMVVALAVLFIVLGAAAWYLFDQADTVEAQLPVDTSIAVIEPLASEPEVVVDIEVDSEADVQVVATVEIEDATVDGVVEPADDVNTEVADVVEPEQEQDIEIVAVVEVPVEIGLDEETALEAVENKKNSPNQLETPKLSNDNADKQLLQPGIGHSQWFQQELSESLDWLKKLNRSQGAIQIMWLGSDSFTESAYGEYIDRLGNRGVNTAQIRIFQADSGRVDGYNVVYGKYRSRQHASDSIAALPKVLRSNSPIPRTIGGILDEINL